MQKIAARVGDKVEILLPDATLIGEVKETLPDGVLKVITEDGFPVLVDPDPKVTNIRVRVIGHATNISANKEESKEVSDVNIGIAAEKVEERRKKVIDITEEEIANTSRFYRVNVPAVAEDGRRIKRQVEVAIRKITNTMAKMDVRDELGTVTFTVMASKRDAGDLYIPNVKSAYNTEEGLKETVVVDITGKPNELLTAIARAVMRAEGITLGGNTLEDIF